MTKQQPIYSSPSLPKLAGEKGWTPDLTDTMKPSTLALQIMAYRRQYRSKGIANFAKTLLEPLITQIHADLEKNGYTVAVQVLGSEHGYKNYCFDVSKDTVMGDTLYVAHYDIVDVDYSFSKSAPNERLVKKVNVKDGIAFLDMSHVDNINVGCLGADDGAGLAVMLNLMSRGILGGYCFTTGEECGGIGAEVVLNSAPTFLKQYKRSVEIDRRGTTDLVYSQGVGECASLEFTQWLCDELKMGHEPSELGSYTDNATFAEVIPENVNIASGYLSAHSTSEEVDLVYLDNLAEALSNITLERWESSPTVRKPNDFNRAPDKHAYYGDYSGLCAGDIEGVDFSLDFLLTLFQLDKEFMLFALASTIETSEDLDNILYDFYRMGLSDADLILAGLLQQST